MSNLEAPPVPATDHKSEGPEPEKRRSVWIDRAIVFAGLLALLATGVYVGHQTAPTTIETVTETINTETTIEKTPASCIEALDLAADVVTILAETVSLGGDATSAAINRDASGIDKITETVVANNAKLDGITPDLGIAAQSCRASQ